MGSSSITGDETILFADNMSFDGTPRGGKMTTNGQLWIGSTASPHVRTGGLTSSDSSITITNGAGTIDLKASGSLPYISLSPFIVGTDAHSGYTTIAAAVAAAQGAGAANATPLNVYIKPKADLSAYTENLTLPAGVNLIAFDPLNNSQGQANPVDAVRIVGTITGTSGGVNKISNLSVTTTGSADSFVMANANIYLYNVFSSSAHYNFNFAASGNVFIDNCQMQGTGYIANDGGTGNIGMYVDNSTMSFNTGIAATNGSGTTTIIVRNSIFGAAALSCAGSTVNVSFYESNVIFDSFTSSGSAAASSSFLCYNCQYSNAFSTTIAQSAFVLLFENCDMQTLTMSTNGGKIIGGKLQGLTSNAGVTANLDNVTFDASSNPAIAGAGVVTFSNLGFVNTGNTITTTTQNVNVTNRGAQRTISPAGDYTVLGSDEVVFATSSAARAIALNASPSTGQTVTIKDLTGTAGTNNITITPAAGNIDGSGTYVITANYGSVTLVYSGSQWFVI